MTPASKSTFVLGHRHLLGIEGLSADDITGLLDLSEEYVELNRQVDKKRTSLRGRTQVNLFFEASTRTQSSFEIAGKRLGADVMNMSVSSSSMRKGETLIDTAVTLNAMHPDILVVRHHASGAVELLARKVDGSVINAGDGAHEHPTQALLDALTIRRNKGRLEGLVIAICGDVMHSRVARSNILLLNTMGALDAAAARHRADGRRGGARHARGPQRRRHCHDAAAATRAHERLVRAVDPGILPLFRARPEEAGLRQARRAGDASRPDEPRRRNRLDRGGWRAIADPRTGGNGSGGADGGARSARPQPAERLNMLTDRRPILLANARVVDPSRDLDGPGDVLIADGVIRDSRRGIGAAGVPEGTDIINCAGKVVAPGLIDMRAFVGEPGASHRETFASASQAAAAGGITTIICQPDTAPAIDNSATVDFVLRRARDTAIVNIHPMAALTKGLLGQEMTEIGLLKAAGAVAFTDGDRSVTNAQVMRRALTYARDFDALIVHHTEDPDLVGEGVMNEGEFAARLGLVGIPNAAEAVMLERDMRLVALTGGRYHAAAVSCIESLEILQRARDAGLAVSASVSINHVTLNENDIGPYRTFLKLSPPLRTEEDRLALVSAVASGLIDVLMSHHNPQDVEVKRLPFAEAASGAIGLQTMLPAGLRLIHNGGVDFMTLMRALSTRPAELLGLPGGSLRSGSPADLIVIHAETPWVLH